ncbi:hypothetical protein AXF42_Ash005694 [Apostasia shenzhenica]|uniref:Uncharacterized protein n=1 Tax=Apostasia shenzhenica TaxID=1088818 RepID=A0A2I0BC45_9ASPA|nr:hypothetical protein AXF42_Ash005694 [Apostasia shenzhenica]
MLQPLQVPIRREDQEATCFTYYYRSSLRPTEMGPPAWAQLQMCIPLQKISTVPYKYL